jgi:hypothetical protein
MGVELCPLCKNGFYYNPKTGSTVCKVCKGLGMVDPDTTCICSRSVTERREGVDFCGREECFRKLKL